MPIKMNPFKLLETRQLLLVLRNCLAFIIRHIPIRGRWRLTRYVVGDVKESTPVTAMVPRLGTMELDLQSDLEREVFITGTHGEENLVAEAIAAYLKDSDSVFVDVGANVGYHTVRIARKLADSGGQVIAFEPIQANYDRLVTNLRLNELNNVSVEKLGLSDKNESVDVYRSTRGSANVSLASSGQYRESVQLVKFDDWLIRHPLSRIDVIKMDIEGAETRALRGMRNTLAEYRPIMIIEINPMWTSRMETSTTELINLLHEYTYMLLNVKDHEVVTWVDPDGDREVNVIAIPAERAE